MHARNLTVLSYTDHNQLLSPARDAYMMFDDHQFGRLEADVDEDNFFGQVCDMEGEFLGQVPDEQMICVQDVTGARLMPPPPEAPRKSKSQSKGQDETNSELTDLGVPDRNKRHLERIEFESMDNTEDYIDRLPPSKNVEDEESSGLDEYLPPPAKKRAKYLRSQDDFNLGEFPFEMEELQNQLPEVIPPADMEGQNQLPEAISPAVPAELEQQNQLPEVIPPAEVEHQDQLPEAIPLDLVEEEQPAAQVEPAQEEVVRGPAIPIVESPSSVSGLLELPSLEDGDHLRPNRRPVNPHIRRRKTKLDKVCQISKNEMRARQLNDEYGEECCLPRGFEQCNEMIFKSKYGREHQIQMKRKKLQLQIIPSRVKSRRLGQFFERQLGRWELAGLEERETETEEVEEVENLVVPQPTREDPSASKLSIMRDNSRASDLTRRDSLLRSGDHSNLRVNDLSGSKLSINETRGKLGASTINPQIIPEEEYEQDQLPLNEDPLIENPLIEDPLIEEPVAELSRNEVEREITRVEETPEEDANEKVTIPETQDNEEEQVNLTPPVPMQEEGVVLSLVEERPTVCEEVVNEDLVALNAVKERLAKCGPNARFSDLLDENANRRTAALTFRHLLTLQASNFVKLSQDDVFGAPILIERNQ